MSKCKDYTETNFVAKQSLMVLFFVKQLRKGTVCQQALVLVLHSPTPRPRHFCKSCRRYWTHGGALRDISVVGGTHKNAKRQKLIKPTLGFVTTSSLVEYRSLVPPPPVAAARNGIVLFDGNRFMALLGLGGFEHGVWPFCGNNCDSGELM
ncbi:hypothetical protein CTI12_AA383900 [Artemisia annua]|uniref:Dof-type domain-containing protein n=1 Tax=Artemisia annua TaxID=35608 RepID=A0A2U1LW32_ARTAN|nr:hypothetical protein CTI12_AA383900 [Artemisia annua]